MADLTRIRSKAGAPFTVSGRYAPKFQALVDDLEASGYSIRPEQSGGYNPRKIAGTNTWSNHAFGNAIDVNWTNNARGTKGDIDPTLARSLAAKHGFRWGGDWSNPDPMHFEVANASSPAVAQRSFTNYAGLGGPPSQAGTSTSPMSQGSPSMPYQNGKYIPEDAIAQQYKYADNLQNQNWAPTWSGVLAAGLGGLGSGLHRNSAQNALQGNQGMMSQALLNAGKAPDLESATSALVESGAPDAQKLGVQQRMQTLGDDPNKPYRVRAAQAEQHGLVKGSPEWKSFVLTGQIASAATAKVDTPDERAAAAKQYGMDPSSDAFRQFVLTGRMPREDQQALTATDKKAILEADDQVGTNQAVIKALGEAESLNDQANQGWFAGTRASIGNNLPDWMVPDVVSSPASSAATTNLDNAVVGQALTQLKAVFGGNPTEGERKILLDLQGSSGQPKAVRAEIFARAKRAADARLAINIREANQLRGGTYYKPGGGATGESAPVVVPSAPAPVSEVPAAGTEMDGYVFKGGNPADPNSWEKK